VTEALNYTVHVTSVTKILESSQAAFLQREKGGKKYKLDNECITSKQQQMIIIFFLAQASSHFIALVLLIHTCMHNHLKDLKLAFVPYDKWKLGDDSWEF
jgi:hypothetical protein